MVPTDELLNHAPLGANLVVDVVQLLQLPLLPLLLVHRRIHKVYPLFTQLDFTPLKALLSESIGDPLPFFGFVEGVLLEEELDFLGRAALTAFDHSAFFLFLYINKIFRIHNFCGKKTTFLPTPIKTPFSSLPPPSPFALIRNYKIIHQIHFLKEKGTYMKKMRKGCELQTDLCTESDGKK